VTTSGWKHGSNDGDHLDRITSWLTRGSHIISPAEDESLADFRPSHDLKPDHVSTSPQLVGRRMLAQVGEGIVNIASIMGLVASPPQGGQTAIRGDRQPDPRS